MISEFIQTNIHIFIILNILFNHLLHLHLLCWWGLEYADCTPPMQRGKNSPPQKGVSWVWQ